MRVLVTDGMDAGAVEQLRKDGYEIVEQFYEPDQLGTALRDFDAVIIRSATKIKEPQIDAAKGSRLKLIIRAGVGVDNIAVKYAEAAGFDNLKGHKSVGGLRASIYNAMPKEGVEALVEFLKKYEAEHA